MRARVGCLTCARTIVNARGSFQPTRSDRDRDARARGAAQLGLPRAGLLELVAGLGGRRAVDRDDAIVELRCRRRRRASPATTSSTIGYGGTLGRASSMTPGREHDADAAELALGVLAQLLVAVRRQERRVRRRGCGACRASRRRAAASRRPDRRSWSRPVASDCANASNARNRVDVARARRRASDARRRRARRRRTRRRERRGTCAS